jgi:hypothetical protein
MSADAISSVSEVEVHFKLVGPSDVPVERFVQNPLNRFGRWLDAVEICHGMDEQEVDVRLGRAHLGVADEFVVSIAALTLDQVEDVGVVLVVLSSLEQPT